MIADDEVLTFDLSCAALAGIGVAGALLLEHLALWPFARPDEQQDELRPILFYTIGTATIGAGLSLLSLMRHRPQAAVDFWVIAGCGGATIAGLRIVRWRQRLKEEAAHDNGHALGSIHGATIYATERGDRTYRPYR